MVKPALLLVRGFKGVVPLLFILPGLIVLDTVACVKRDETTLLAAEAGAQTLLAAEAGARFARARVFCERSLALAADEARYAPFVIPPLLS